MYAPGGNNFQPGEERVHINHWIFAGQTTALAGDSSALPASSTFVLSKFKFTPLTELLKNHDRSVSMPWLTICHRSQHCRAGLWLMGLLAAVMRYTVHLLLSKSCSVNPHCSSIACRSRFAFHAGNSTLLEAAVAAAL